MAADGPFEGFPGADEPLLFAGLDVSTQGCKLVVLDAGAGQQLHVGRLEYDQDLPAYGTVGGVVPGLGEGVSESDPQMWLEAVELLLGDLPAAGVPSDKIRCISVSGQQHGLVALTEEGRLARPRSKLWNDVSTAEECAILTRAVGGRHAMIAEVGNTQRPGYTASKILHFRRHEPQRYALSRVLFLVHNYVNWHLTGGPEGGVAVMEPGDTSGMALWHPGRRSWSKRVIEAIDPDLLEKLPPVLPSDRTIGRLSQKLADRFGLSPSCRVDAGSGDNMYGAVGTGNFRPGIVTVSLGTSGTAYTYLEEPFIDPLGEIAAFADSTGHHLPLLCVSNMANGYEAFRRGWKLSHEAFDALVQSVPPGNGGRVLVPWYEGERTPDLPEAAALSFGFGLADLAGGRLEPSGIDGTTDRAGQPLSGQRVFAQFARAIVEGHVLNLWSGATRLPIHPGELRLTGGLAASPVWRQVLADVFDAEVVPVEGEGAALGAAIHAAWVWAKESGVECTLGEVADPFVSLGEAKRARPDPRTRRVMEFLRRLYRSLALRLTGQEGEDPFRLRRELLAAAEALQASG